MAFLATYPERSTTRNMLFQKYLKSTGFVPNAASKEEMAKFQRLVTFFQSHSDTYDMDYLLMAAQGYQESRLDQSAKSRVGAIGVMQVMPSTGRDMKVGDISKKEPNVHAGVKYMRFMIDQSHPQCPRISPGLWPRSAERRATRARRRARRRWTAARRTRRTTPNAGRTIGTPSRTRAMTLANQVLSRCVAKSVGCTSLRRTVSRCAGRACVCPNPTGQISGDDE